MNAEEQIRKLSLRVSAAPEGSEEFGVAMNELRTGIKDSAQRGRQKIGAMKGAPSPSDDRFTIRRFTSVPSRKQINLEKTKVSLSTRYSQCGHTIEPSALQRIDTDRVRCPKCVATVLPTGVAESKTR